MLKAGPPLVDGETIGLLSIYIYYHHYYIINVILLSPCEFPLVNAITWVPESEPTFYSEFSRNHLVESHDFSIKIE